LGTTKPADRTIYEAESITIPAGATIFVGANDADATYSNISTTGGGGSTTIVDDLTTGGSDAALSADQGVVLKGLVDEKADLLAATDSITEDTSLTVAGHGNRTIPVDGTGIVLTIQADANSGAVGDEVFRGVPESGASFTMAAADGVTILSATGSSLDSSTSATGEVAVQRVGVDTYRTISAAAGSATAGAHKTLANAARVADAASGSTTETVVATFTLPALGANDTIDVDFFVGGSGTAGNRVWTLRLGGTGTNGTTVSNFTQGATFAYSRALLGFANTGSASTQFGVNGGQTVGMGYGNSTGARTGAVDTSSATTLYLTLLKGNAADVVNLESCRCILKPGVV
jgi:hypothetical protein